jgi:hypothetical protein
LTSGYMVLFPTMTNLPRLENWIVLLLETLVGVGRAYWVEKPNGRRRLVAHVEPRLPGGWDG